MREERVEDTVEPPRQLDEADRELFRASVRGVLARCRPIEGAPPGPEDVRSGNDLWRDFAALGVTSLGAGAGGLAEILIACEELGRSGAVAPLLGAAAANVGLASRGPGPSRDLVDGLADGSARVAVALGAFDGDRAAGSGQMSGTRLSGRFRFIEDSAIATHYLAFVSDPPGLAILAAGTAHVLVRATGGMLVPALAEVVVQGGSASFVPVDHDALTDLACVVRMAATSRGLGAAERIFELAVEHAKFRHQFGRAIGTFQAIQHKLADCSIELNGVSLLLAQAAECYDQVRDDWRFFASCAFDFAGRSLRDVAVQSHRVLGAIGYSEEHEAPGHFRQIHGDVARFGGVWRARADLAARVLDADRERALPPHSVDPCVEAFRVRARAWLRENWTEEDRAAERARPFSEQGYNRSFSRRMGEAGWIGIGWPVEHGGQGRSAGEQMAFLEEVAGVEAPVLAHNVGQSIVAQALMRYGTDQQRDEWLGAIRRGLRPFALGYSEAEAGSDLAALRTTAVRDGDAWVVNGEKLWSTGGDKADYVWLAVRTDPEGDKHAGISVLMVDLRSPGITIRPSVALYGKTFSALLFEDVRVPAENMVGPVNGGWRIIIEALVAERVMIGAALVSDLERLADQLVGYVRGVPRNGGHPSDDAVLLRVASLVADIEVARQLQLKSIRMVERGRALGHEAAMVMVFASELHGRLAEAALDMLGSGGLLGEDAANVPLGGRVEQMVRYSIMPMIGGGTCEIQRNIIATRGLAL